MKVVMILPPQVTGVAMIANVATGVGSMLTGRGESSGMFSVFLDTQAELVDLQMNRHLVEHQVPGREGGILQDMGSASSVISLRGKWIYENRPDDDILNFFPALDILTNRMGWNWLRLQVMQVVYRLKFPIFLACDLITTAVMIENMKFTHKGGSPNVYDYTMTLKEFSPVLTVAGTIGVVVSAVGSKLNVPLVNVDRVGY